MRMSTMDISSMIITSASSGFSHFASKYPRMPDGPTFSGSARDTWAGCGEAGTSSSRRWMSLVPQPVASVHRLGRAGGAPEEFRLHLKVADNGVDGGGFSCSRAAGDD